MIKTTNWATLWRKLRARLRIVPAETIDEQFLRELHADFAQKTKEIARGKRKHPAMMTEVERHQATTEVTRKMKWSKSFVLSMTAPFAVCALENGGYAKEPLSGDELHLTPKEMKRLEGVTRENFKDFEGSWSDCTDKQFHAAGEPDAE